MIDHNNTTELSANAVIVGIDRADTEHIVGLIEPDGSLEIDTLQQSPEAIDEWAAGPAGRDGCRIREPGADLPNAGRLGPGA
jgi:hypothetical protein